MTDPPPGTMLEIHRPHEGRKARNWGVFFGGVALLAGVVLGVPAVYRSNRAQDRYNRELSCRAQINNATTAVNASIILDFTDLSLASIGNIDRADAVASLQADRKRAAVLKPIQLAAVETCHTNPNYQLPP